MKVRESDFRGELPARQIVESENQTAEYIRFTCLIPKLLDMADEEKLAFPSAAMLFSCQK